MNFIIKFKFSSKFLYQRISPSARGLMIMNHITEVPEDIKVINKELILGLLTNKKKFGTNSIKNNIENTTEPQSKSIGTSTTNLNSSVNKPISFDFSNIDRVYSYMSINTDFGNLITDLKIDINELNKKDNKVCDFIINKIVTSQLSKLNNEIKKYQNAFISLENIG